MISLSHILIQQGYLTEENYQYAYQLQQAQPVEYRKPLAQIYLELGLLGVEHIEYALGLKQEYIMNGLPPEYSEQGNYQQDYQQQPQQQAPQQGGTVICKTCFSECTAGWAACPYCGSAL
ncbi:MAG: hypothetical protein U0457_00350 [Candidatus Sericytochromatia bacterium]